MELINIFNTSDANHGFASAVPLVGSILQDASQYFTPVDLFPMFPISLLPAGRRSRRSPLIRQKEALLCEGIDSRPLANLQNGVNK